MIFTPELKDELLNFLIFRPGDWPDNFRMIDNSVLKEKKMTLDEIRPLIEYFERLNFIEVQLNNFSIISFHFQQEAVDFLGRGGFLVQEEMFENNIKKLLLEIDTLKKELTPDRLETINKIASIGNNILSGLSFIAAAKLH